MSDSEGVISNANGEAAESSHTRVQDPTGLVRLPANSVRVEDPEEEARRRIFYSSKSTSTDALVVE